jgi:hypothetical protein
MRLLLRIKDLHSSAQVSYLVQQNTSQQVPAGNWQVMSCADSYKHLGQLALYTNLSDVRQNYGLASLLNLPES